MVRRLRLDQRLGVLLKWGGVALSSAFSRCLGPLSEMFMCHVMFEAGATANFTLMPSAMLGLCSAVNARSLTTQRSFDCNIARCP